MTRPETVRPESNRPATRILLAGDHFVRNSLLAEALHRALGPLGTEPQLGEVTLPWPWNPSARSPRSTRRAMSRTR